MVVWIIGEKDLLREKLLAEAIAGAYVKGISLHGEEVRKEFKISSEGDGARLVLAYRLAMMAKILAKQGCIVAVGHDEDQKVVNSLRRVLGDSLLVLVNAIPIKGTTGPFMLWEKSDKVNDRDLLVEEILRRLKGEGYGNYG